MAEKARINPETEKGFSFFLVIVIALAIVLLLAKVISVDSFGFSYKDFEEQIKKSDAH